jgi:hypothetical protein
LPSTTTLPPSPDRFLYVCDTAPSVRRYDAATGVPRGAAGNPDDAVLVPGNRPGSSVGGVRGMALSADGMLFARVSGIQRFDARTGANLGPGGNPLSAFIHTGGPDLGALSLGFALGPDGLLYAANNDLGAKDIRRFDPSTGDFLGVFVPAMSGGLQNPRGLAFGPDGHLYVGSVGEGTSPTAASILRYDGATGAPLPAPGRSGATFGLAAPLEEPTWLAFRSDGDLFASQPHAGNVLRFVGSTGAFAGVFIPSLAPPDVNVEQVGGLAFGPDGDLYLAHSAGRSIRRYHGGSATFLGLFVPAGGGGLVSPQCLEFLLLPPVVVTTTSTTTDTTLPPSSTTIAAAVCGDGVVSGDEACDPAAPEGCAATEVCGAAGLTEACRCVAVEQCDNCRDDDGDGLVDFEDPACCSTGQSLGTTLTGAKIRAGDGTSRLTAKLTIAAAAGLAIGSYDLTIQLRQAGGDELLCGRIPADRFVAVRAKRKFADRKRQVVEAMGIDKVVMTANDVDSATIAIGAKKAAFDPPPPGPLRVTIGFRDPTTAEATDRCASIEREFRAGKRRTIQFP